ncbi:MAG: substrate-binding domain-containing protein, partial [Acinetobacter sp.]
GGYSATKALLSRGIPFRSIFACTDMIALGVLKAFSEKGIRCPEDVAVISYDNTTFSQMSLPAMTTVDMQAKNLGKQGALMLLDMIDSKTLTKQKLMLYPKLVVRDST